MMNNYNIVKSEKVQILMNWLGPRIDLSKH